MRKEIKFIIFNFNRWYWYWYNSKLGLDYNLGKDLRKNEENNQLVNYKDTKLYLQLYRFNNYKK